MAGNEAGHGAIVRNRDLIDVWIEAPRGNRKQVVHEKILSLIDITDEPSKHLKSNIMKYSQLFGLKMANKWQKVGQSRNRLLQNQVYRLDKIINRINNDSEENTSSDKEQVPPCRSVGRPWVPFEEASKKTKRRRVAELTTDRSANELPFAVNVVSESNHSDVSPQIFSFSTAEALALMVDLNISVRGPENKAIVEANKKRIQAEFRAKLSLIVDKPKPGYGSSNDGNTARIYFHNPQTSSDITGVDRELIEKFAIILGVLASGCAIDMEKFASLLEEARNFGEKRGGALSAVNKMNIFLRQLSDPGFQNAVAEELGVYKTYTSVLNVVLEKANIWIKFPKSADDFMNAKQLWSEKYRFPNSIGAIDCTHVRIPKFAEFEYINRKGYPSISIQATCNAK
ncbi:unnamed protein product [Acanthoscelides obtectus]|uniref:Nuclease HARBI1 n=1 Tax=Acanthoscelides obtectus TaxID=200917 RepID=A0A9P0PFS8_ACAOB|nr:unnamed protein product [Acanthoscelides obtectus]CAK1654842.1 hypothetical protein AOBTE_LOCUS18889 [Acanthoscelides obtectus]